MKLPARFKWIFYSCVVMLYLSGVVFFLSDHFFQVKTEFGMTPPAAQIHILHIHSIVGLFFIFAFGYIYRVHVEPGLRGTRRRKSGISLLAVIAFLCLTVPFLFYATDESLRSSVAAIHTYIGLATVLPFLLHFLLRDRKKKKERPRR